MELFDFIKKAYYVNLNSRKDKQLLIEEHFKEIGIDKYVERFSAVTPLDLGYTPDENGIYSHDATNKANIYSQIAIIEESKKLGLENVLIFEDDARFYFEDKSYNPFDIISSAIDSLKNIPDWDIFFLGTNSGTRETIFEQYGSNLVKTPECIAAHAYIVNNRAYDRFIEKAKNEYAIDIFMSVQFDKKYLVYPMAVYQNSGPLNDIGQNFHGYDIEWWKSTYNKKLIKNY
jgi:GR25 family glycosyltransferase involved in LPS biosynthesis